MKFTLPGLPYNYSALEPYIDAKTMEIHHSKHHQGYVNKLNKALEKHPKLTERSLEELLQNSDNLPEDAKTAIKNNGGGHFNHSLFWTIMAPNAENIPPKKLLAAINSGFGDFNTFKEQFTQTALTQFGSGWAWLVINSTGSLEVTSSPNQDSPLTEGKKVILCLDVWEHAYYLKYQNRRAEYVENWWNVVNWKQVGDNFLKYSS